MTRTRTLVAFSIACIGLWTQLVLGDGLCDTVTTCLSMGRVDCDRTESKCPPCLYELVDRYSCWEKDPLTKSCPFVGAKADCSLGGPGNLDSNSTNGGSGGNSTRTPSPSGASDGSASPAGFGSKEIMIAAGALALVIVVVIVVAVVRRNRAMRRDPFLQGTPRHKLTGQGGGGGGGLLAPTDESMGSTDRGTDKFKPQSYTYPRKVSEISMLEAPRDSDTQLGYRPRDSDTQLGYRPRDSDTQPGYRKISVDAMLEDRSDMVGTLHRIKGNNVNRVDMNAGFKHLSKELPLRITQNHNLVQEYLRMKEEMNYDVDTLSDLDSELYSDTASEQKLSIGSSIMDITRTLADSGYTPDQLVVPTRDQRINSLADSEYTVSSIQSGGESDTDSEMSYNDEKYSFIEDYTDDVARSLDREVEI